MRGARSGPAWVLPLGLFVAGCGPKPAEPPLEPPTANPPPPEAPPVPPPTNPPRPELEALPTEIVAPPGPPPPGSISVNPPPRLPRWDEVPSGHPAGATNPPSPVLLATPDGRCFKQWVSPMIRGDFHRDRVTECPNPDPIVGDCGTPIECPPDAAERTKPKPPP